MAHDSDAYGAAVTQLETAVWKLLANAAMDTDIHDLVDDAIDSYVPDA